MSLTNYQRFDDSGWKGWVHDRWAGSLSKTDPLNKLLGWTNQLVHQRPMSCTWRVDSPHQIVYAKLVSSANHPDITPGRWEAQLKQSLGPSVALRTHQVTQRMLDCGVRVPEILIAAQRRQGWHCDDLLTTKAVVGSALTEALSAPHERCGLHDLLHLVGRSIAHLHQAGFVHGHLVPGHIIIGPDRSAVWFLDNDETRWRPTGVRSADRRYNLTQLVSRLSASHHPNATGLVRRLIESYAESIDLAGHQRRRWHYQILKNARNRNRKRRRRRTYRPLPPVGEPALATVQDR